MSVVRFLLIAALSLCGVLATLPADGDELLSPSVTHWASVPGEAEEAYGLDPSEPAGSGVAVVALQPDEAIVPAHETLIPETLAPPLRRPYPVVINEWVEYFLERFQAPSRRGIVALWLNRSGRYLEMMRDVFREHGLPEELAYVAMIESGFNPVAVSRAGAKGLWQFMEHTARRYGLRVDRWVDERLDPEKSTVAAAQYLRDLFGQFGSWVLAKAAYNAGELKVIQALERSRTNDFWALSRGRVLREETKRFVPAILAATLIGKDPERYGFDVTPDPPLTYDLVMAPPLLPLTRLAARAGIDAQELNRLNPELRRGVTPPGGPYPLKVPPGTEAAVSALLEQMASTLAKGTVHVVKPRESLWTIAKRHGVSVADLVRWNALANGSRIFPGDRLQVADPR
ncbi:MAG: transglycosylase SLT domain-containing protein [Candidatus Rokubacteria bacterium]|nr:transglycosylase SLT domain-containing protein [Candidatus Rokubacteria bacterium]